MKKLTAIFLAAAITMPMAAHISMAETLSQDMSDHNSAATPPASAEHSGQEEATAVKKDTGKLVWLKNGNKVEIKNGEAMVVSPNGSVPLKDGTYETKTGKMLTVQDGKVVWKHHHAMSASGTAGK